MLCFSAVVTSQGVPTLGCGVHLISRSRRCAFKLARYAFGRDSFSLFFLGFPLGDIYTTPGHVASICTIATPVMS